MSPRFRYALIRFWHELVIQEALDAGYVAVENVPIDKLRMHV